MSENKHTPGPWHVCGNDNGPGERYLHIGAKSSMMVLASMNEVHTDTVANARLMAAAPDLLRAAQRALNVIRHTTGATATSGNVVGALESAIAKAEAAQ